MLENKPAERQPPQILADRLVAATFVLGGNARNVRELFDHAGMPSEYRSGLAGAREAAESFLRRQTRGARSAANLGEQIGLAESVVELTHAIVFSMRHSLDYKDIFESAVEHITARLERIDASLLDRNRLALRLEPEEIRDERPSRKPPRTSASHPLRIDSVRLANGGEIGMTIFPGRIDHLSPDGPWARSLDADLAVIAAWHPAMMITLVEDFEFAMLGAPQFVAEMARIGLPWRHLPIVDGGVPAEEFENEWRTVGDEARSALLRGERVVLHCRAGLGRTGMMAARLLVELGDSPDEAILRVRAARRGTIETARQEAHVRTSRRV